MKPQRVFIFDLLRIVLIILIINLHIQIITHIPRNFLVPFVWYAVPLFIVLSFYLSFDKKPAFARIKRLILPLIAWSAAGFLVHPQLINLPNIVMQLLTGEVVNVPLYYLSLMISFTLLFWLITLIPVRFRNLLFFGIIILAFVLEYSSVNFYFFKPQSIVIRNSYGRFVELVKYVPVGIVFGIIMTKKERSVILLLITVISLLIRQLSMQIPQPPGFHYSGLEIFLSTIVIFSVVLLLKDIQFNKKINNLIGVLGRLSFGVYLFHFIFLEFLLKIFPGLKIFIVSYSLFFMIIYTFSCFLLCILIDRLSNKRLSFLIE